MKRILFVDDDVNTLNGLRRALYSMRHEWQLEFEQDPRVALRSLTHFPPDVLVVDVQMPEMDGLQLLRHAKKACPRAARLVLSGEIQKDQFARSFQSMHLFLGKPCDMQLLKRRIRRVLSYGDRIPDQSLKSLISQLAAVPSLPILAASLHKEFQSPRPDIDEIAAIVSMDIGMSASMLHLANSGYYRPNLPVSSPELAVRWLGLERVRSFFVSCGLSASLDLTHFDHFNAAALWRASMARATAARAAVLAESRNPVLADEAFTAGLLQDIGQVVLASILRKSYDDIVRQSILRAAPLWKVEREFTGSTHADAGAYLLALWGLPEPVLHAVLFHHSLEERKAELVPAAAHEG